MTSALRLPEPVRSFFDKFPLHTYPESFPISHPSSPTLWILPPKHSHTHLSDDVECLKWQAYLALRGLTDVKVRWDISVEGGLNGSLPTLHLPSGELLSAVRIPTWADEAQKTVVDPLEGCASAEARDESRAWVSLLEGVVHAALVLSKPPPTLRDTLRGRAPLDNVASLLHPPPAPLSGTNNLLPPTGVNIPVPSVNLRFREAVNALSERLASDKWFLGSRDPTPLDALAFAYIHSILHCTDDTLRGTVERRANLVAWERKVRALVLKK